MELPSREKVLTWSCGAETWSTYFLSRSKRWLWRRHVDHLKPLQESPSTESTSFSNDAEPDEAVDDDTHLPFTDNAITLNPDQSTQPPESPLHQRHRYPQVITINLFGMVVQSLTSWSRNYEHVETFITTCGLLYSIVFL